MIDPACGSGNFLTETYISLRRLENETLKEIFGEQIILDFGNIIKVSIGQFYGIEINDFAVTVAKTALWIAESQMMKETEEIIHSNLEFLPLKSYANIVEGNALRIDWETVVPKDKLNYIMGNPPFVGYTYQTSEQKSDLILVTDNAGKNLDYVAGWYFKAAQMINNTTIRVAFVSTNSITQGEQVASVWKPIHERYKIHLDFAHRTFRWDSEANAKAQVHCVIIGFSAGLDKFDLQLFAGDSKKMQARGKEKILFNSDRVQLVENINYYLIDAPTIFIESRKTPISKVPKIIKGSIPVDDGNFLLNSDEYEDFIKNEPSSIEYIKPYCGAREFLHNEKRWCLWLDNISPSALMKLPLIKQRVAAVKEFRLKSSKEATRKYAEFPTQFMEVRQPKTEYIIVPSHSSERRKYIPMGFVNPDVICSNANLMIPNATLLHFGVLTSNVHMAWVRAICGRIKSDYRYSNDIVYNNFPWPNPTEEQKAAIEKTAQAILDARAKYPDCSLADLYDEVAMPPELRKAHQENDKAVMKAYGFWGKLNTESECVAELMKMYQELVK